MSSESDYGTPFSTPTSTASRSLQTNTASYSTSYVEQESTICSWHKLSPELQTSIVASVWERIDPLARSADQSRGRLRLVCRKWSVIVGELHFANVNKRIHFAAYCGSDLQLWDEFFSREAVPRSAIERTKKITISSSSHSELRLRKMVQLTQLFASEHGLMSFPKGKQMNQTPTSTAERIAAGTPYDAIEIAWPQVTYKLGWRFQGSWPPFSMSNDMVIALFRQLEQLGRELGKRGRGSYEEVHAATYRFLTTTACDDDAAEVLDNYHRDFEARERRRYGSRGYAGEVAWEMSRYSQSSEPSSDDVDGQNEEGGGEERGFGMTGRNSVEMMLGSE
ncbi:hypothetical protein LTS10_004338 [Elasticomyces elasticus]|nr:hypothetical protein LTS10_004338 [Elasticomyces elasticus]